MASATPAQSSQGHGRQPVWLVSLVSARVVVHESLSLTFARVLASRPPTPSDHAA